MLGCAAVSAPENADASSDTESVRKIYVKDLREKETVRTVFKVSQKKKITSRAGKAFLALSLVDRTGEIEARIFEAVDAADAAFGVDDYLLVRGEVGSFHGKPQLVLQSQERLDPGPIDAREFTPPPAPPPSAQPASEPQAHGPSKGGGERAVAQIREQVERVQDPHVKAILLAFLDDPAISRGLPQAPAAKGIHHAYTGGLADHILSVMRLAHRMADHYPMVDRDLLVAGALLHDIGKVTELTYVNGNFDYSDEGRLVGHLVMTAQMIREKALALTGFPRELEWHLTHIVLAHHGQLEYGSPKLPVTLEAHLVHAIDSLDSRVASWLDLMAKDPAEKWTAPSRLYDRHLWKGTLPTIRNKGPVPPRRPKGERPERKKAPRKEGKPAPQKEKEAEAKPAEKPELSFKPFEALVSQVQPPAPAPAAAPAPAEVPPSEPTPAGE